MATEPHSAADRLAAVKLDLPKIERYRDLIMARRLECLIVGDVAGRRECDHQRHELELDLQAAHDAIAALSSPQVAMRERAAQKVLPTSREQARARRLALQPRLGQLASIPWQAKNAGEQTEYDTLRQQDWYFAGLERTLPEEAAA